MDQTLKTGTILKVGQLSDILGKNIETDLTINDLYALQKQYSKLDNLSIHSIDIKGKDQLVDGLSYYIPEKQSLNEVSDSLRTLLKLNKSEFVTNADFAQ